MAIPGFLKSKIAAPDVLRLLWLWTVIALAGFGRVFWEIYRPAEGGRDQKAHMLGRDFVNVWQGAKLAGEGKISSLYTVSDYMAAIHKSFGDDYPQHNFSYPPHLVCIILVFGLMPYFPALALWTAAGFAAIGTALRKWAKQSWAVVALAVLSPASVANVVSGQNGAFTGACFLGGLYLCEGAPIPAGVLFGLLTVKPHLGILIPFVLLLRRNWKCIASAGATVLAMAGFSLLLWGVTPWKDYIDNVIPYQATLLSAGQAFYHRMTPGVFFDLANIIPEWAKLIHALIALPVAAAALWAVRKEGITPRTVLILSIATMIVVPYGFNYDMVAIAGALAIYLATLPEEYSFVHLLYGLLWTLPLAVYEIKRLPEAPICSAVLLASFTWLVFSRASGKSEIR